MLQENQEIYAFSQGKCVKISTISNLEVETIESNLGCQFQDMVSTIQQLSQAVNLNAKYLKSLEKKNGFLEEQIQMVANQQNLNYNSVYLTKQLENQENLSGALSDNNDFHSFFMKDFADVKKQISGFKDKFRMVQEQLLEVKTDFFESENKKKSSVFGDKIQQVQMQFISQLEKLKTQFSECSSQKEVSKMREEFQFLLQEVSTELMDFKASQQSTLNTLTSTLEELMNK